jgi:hypothetical protein
MILDVPLVRFNERSSETDPSTYESSIKRIPPSIRGISGERIGCGSREAGARIECALGMAGLDSDSGRVTLLGAGGTRRTQGEGQPHNCQPLVSLHHHYGRLK